MLLLKLTLIQLLLLQIAWAEKSTLQLNKRLAVGIEARGPSNIEYDVNILTKLNSNYVFPLVIGQDERTNLWLLSQQTPATFNTPDKTPNRSLCRELSSPLSAYSYCRSVLLAGLGKGMSAPGRAREGDS